MTFRSDSDAVVRHGYTEQRAVQLSQEQLAARYSQGRARQYIQTSYHADQTKYFHANLSINTIAERLAVARADFTHYTYPFYRANGNTSQASQQFWTTISLRGYPGPDRLVRLPLQRAQRPRQGIAGNSQPTDAMVDWFAVHPVAAALDRGRHLRPVRGEAVRGGEECGAQVQAGAGPLLRHGQQEVQVVSY